MNQLDKRMKMFLGGSMVLLVAVIAMPSKGEESTPNTAPANLAAQPLEATGAPAISTVDDPIAQQRKRSAELEWNRNPFQDPQESISTPTSGAQSTAKGLPKLSGISTINDAKMAIIGRQIVGVGDRLDSGHLVMEVTDKAVHLEKDGKRYTLTLDMNL